MKSKVPTFPHFLVLVNALSLLASLDAAPLREAAVSHAISVPSKTEDPSSRIEERMINVPYFIQKVSKVPEKAVEDVSEAAVKVGVNEIEHDKSIKELYNFLVDVEHRKPTFEEAALTKPLEEEYTRLKFVTEATDISNTKETTEKNHKHQSDVPETLSANEASTIAKLILNDPNNLNLPSLKSFLDSYPGLYYQVLSVELEKTFSHDIESLSNLLKQGGDIGMILQVHRLNNWRKEIDSSSISPLFEVPEFEGCLEYIKSKDFENWIDLITRINVDAAPYKILLRELKNRLSFDQLAQLLLGASTEREFVQLVGKNLERELFKSWLDHCTQEQVRELLKIEKLNSNELFKSPVTRLYLLYITESSSAMQTECLEWLTQIYQRENKAVRIAATAMEYNKILLFRLQMNMWKRESMLNLFKRFHFGQVKFSTQKNPLFTLWVDIAYKRLAKLEAVNVLVKEALLDYKGVDKAQLPTVEILRTFEDYSSDRSRNVMLNAAKHLLKCLEIDQAGAEQFQSSRRLFWNEFIQGMEATEIGQVIATHHNDLELEGLLPAAFKNEDAVALSYAEDLSEGISRKRNRGGDSLAALRSIETQAGNVPEAKVKRLRTG